jgi:hypothetical protein
LISKVAPTYKSEVDVIVANSSYSETEKLIRTQQKEIDLVESINVRIVELNKEITRTPLDENLKLERDELQAIKAEAENRFDEREQLITSKARSEMNVDQFLI